MAEAQNRAQNAKPVLNFIHHALAPARFPSDPQKFEDLRASVNVPLAFLGLQFQSNGKFAKVSAATTISEAEQRTSQLRASLLARAVHADVLRFCRAELLSDNYFHAVQEACKSVSAKVRTVSGLTGDGGDLVDRALGGVNPMIRINAFATQSEKSEQSGFVNLLKGLYGVFRNPTTHEAKIAWPMREDDALDLFSLASYAHRRIDRATKRS